MIIDLQRRIAEVGRIRIGQQVTSSNGKSRPAKLDTFRLTSSDRVRITHAAHLFSGTVREWHAPAGTQWEVVTTTDALKVIVPPSDMAFTQHYELWAAGGCQRRCDGRTESISDAPCLCDPDARECQIHTRLSVMLADLPGLGVWRLDTQGYYAAVELQGAVGVVQLAAGRGQMLPATLRLEQRMTKRVGQGTRRFAVPVLDIDVSPAQLLRGGADFDPLDAGTVAIEAPRGYEIDPEWAENVGDPASVMEAGAHLSAPCRMDAGGRPLAPMPIMTPVPESLPSKPVGTVAQQASATRERKPRKGAAQPIPRTGLAPRTVVQAASATVDDRAPEPPDTAHLSRRMHALFNQADIPKDDRDDRLAVTRSILGRDDITSSNDLTPNEMQRLVDKLNSWERDGDLGAMVTEILNTATIESEQDGVAADG